MLEAIQAVNAAATAATQAATQAGAQPQAPGVPFSDLMTDSINSVNQLETQARQAVQGLMSGEGVDVHQAVIAQEKASMAFEMALSVRNKAVAAYQQVIGMQF